MKALFTLATLALAGSLAFAADVKYAPGAYDVDGSHSKVGFEIPHMVISSVDGQFTKYEGKLKLDKKFEKSSVKATIETASIDTGNVKRDDHLRGADFFDATKYPQIKFESTEIKGTPESFKLTGNLTMHGVTKKVTLDSKMLGSVNDGYGNDRAAFTATTKLNRKDFGLTWSKSIEAGPVVGDDLTLTLKVEAVKPADKK